MTENEFRWQTACFLLTCLTLLAAIGDNITTGLVLGNYKGAAVEANPFSRFLFEAWSVEAALGANLFWTTTAVVWLHWTAYMHRSYLALIVMVTIILIPRGYAAWHNYQGYQLISN